VDPGGFGGEFDYESEGGIWGRVRSMVLSKSFMIWMEEVIWVDVAVSFLRMPSKISGPYSLYSDDNLSRQSLRA
jgi:hypothetical protein